MQIHHDHVLNEPFVLLRHCEGKDVSTSDLYNYAKSLWIEEEREQQKKKGNYRKRKIEERGYPLPATCTFVFGYHAIFVILYFEIKLTS
jgi:hypothetical protein